MRKVIVTALFVGLMCFASQASAYTWYEYGGHQYALTDTFGSWNDCEAEAASVGGHLVTINDATENEWLPVTFADALSVQEFLWIGLYQIPGSPEPDEGWVWISGEPVTFTGWYSLEPNDHAPGEDYAVIEKWLDPVQWNDWGEPGADELFWPVQGIIEIVPEPSTFALIGLSALMLTLFRCRSKR